MIIWIAIHLSRDKKKGPEITDLGAYGTLKSKLIKTNKK